MESGGGWRVERCREEGGGEWMGVESGGCGKWRGWGVEGGGEWRVVVSRGKWREEGL